MKKRSAYKSVIGIVALCGLSAGHCGTVTLKGDTHVVHSGTLVMYGRRLAADHDGWYALSVGCAVCASYTGPCRSAKPRDLTVTSKMNVRRVDLRRHNNGNGYTGNYAFWTPAVAGDENWIRLDYTCDNADYADWLWVGSSYYRDRYSPRNGVYVVATNHNTGETLTHEWNVGDGSTWRPWHYVRPMDGVVVGASVSVSYPERVVLRGKGAKTQVLRTVQGNVPVYAQIDKAPMGLSCARVSDGAIVDVGVSAAVGVGDSIACTNVQNTAGETSGTLSITAMVR